MSTLTIRGLDDEISAGLRVQAAHHGRSVETEVKAILQESLTPPRGLGSRIHARFAGLGEPELDIPPRDERPRAPATEDFEETGVELVNPWDDR